MEWDLLRRLSIMINNKILSFNSKEFSENIQVYFHTLSPHSHYVNVIFIICGVYVVSV